MAKSSARLSIAALACVGALFAAPAFAQSSCEADIGKMQQKRQSQIADIHKMTQKTDGKLDPVAACPKLRALHTTEQDVLAYMQKNQNWCNIPDDVIESVKEASTKTNTIAKQACNIAAQMKKQQQQQAAGGGMPGFAPPPAPKLPAGPL